MLDSRNSPIRATGQQIRRGKRRGFAQGIAASNHGASIGDIRPMSIPSLAVRNPSAAGTIPGTRSDARHRTSDAKVCASRTPAIGTGAGDPRAQHGRRHPRWQAACDQEAGFRGCRHDGAIGEIARRAPGAEQRTDIDKGNRVIHPFPMGVRTLTPLDYTDGTLRRFHRFR